MMVTVAVITAGSASNKVLPRMCMISPKNRLEKEPESEPTRVSGGVKDIKQTRLANDFSHPTASVYSIT